MTPGARAIVEYLAEILAKEQLARAPAFDQPPQPSQNAPREEETAAAQS